MPRDELLARIRGKDALVSMLTEQVDRDLMDAADTLKIVANVAVGYNNIDVALVQVSWNRRDEHARCAHGRRRRFHVGAHSGDHARLAEGDRLIRRGAWKGWGFDFMLGSELKGKQLGLVGLGRIGAPWPQRRRPSACAWRTRPAVAADLPDAQALSLDRLLNTSDVVSIHVPLSADTRHLIDRRALARMKRSAYLVNTARGPVVDEEALAWALQQNLLAGAALDVYENEPAVHPDLLTLENVLLVPHLGSGTTETRTAMADLAADNVVAVLSGRPPLTPVQA